MGDIARMAHDNSSRRSPFKTAGRILLILISIALMARFVLVSLPQVRESMIQMKEGKLVFVVAAVAVEVVWVFALSQVYRSGLRGFGGDVGRVSALRISMASFSISRIVPGGGAAGSAWAAREFVKEGNKTPTTVISMMASWWISMTSLAIVVTTAIGFSGALGRVQPVYLAGPASTLVIFVLGGAILGRVIRNSRLRTRAVARFGGALGRFGITRSDLEAELGQIANNLRVRNLLPIGGWAGLSWVVDAAALGFTFAAFGTTVDVGVLMVGYGLANLISALPELTPGWLGVLEATLAGTFGAFGIASGTAVLAVLAYRLASYWLPVLAGLVPAATALKSFRSPKQFRLVRRLRSYALAMVR